MALTLTLTELYRPIEDELNLVRSNVSELWVEALRLVHGTALPQPNVGGKMLRPALCLLSSGAAGATDLGKFVDLATAMELLHLAALAHDDVIDGASLRHGTTSLNARWDNHTAVLGGDYLVARAVAIMTSYRSCAVIGNAIDSVRQMAEGELRNFGRGTTHATYDGCLRLAEQKTASLFAVTCSTPTYLLDTQARDGLHHYGLALGVAFQLVDDILDLKQNSEALGKPSCGDVVEGKETLPILYLRECLNPAEIARLDSLKGSQITDADREWISSMLETTGARERTEAVARGFIDTAQNCLDCLPPSVFRDSMHSVAEFVLVRGA
ncbi:MAG: polyprenyl synthetase family protein [Candidatus Hydrogenedentes bacterium]|nr:polyprenyl synthetase family protein [Candidatus Hydrogenedentota bacterium]